MYTPGALGSLIATLRFPSDDPGGHDTKLPSADAPREPNRRMHERLGDSTGSSPSSPVAYTLVRSKVPNYRVFVWFPNHGFV